MPYNETIHSRVRAITGQWPNSAEKKMFGGICYLIHGHMVAGVYKDYLILRLGEEEARAALDKAHVQVFDITGRPMKGWVMVAEPGFADLADLLHWMTLAKQFVEKLPPK